MPDPAAAKISPARQGLGAGSTSLHVRTLEEGDGAVLARRGTGQGSGSRVLRGVSGDKGQRSSEARDLALRQNPARFDAAEVTGEVWEGRAWSFGWASMAMQRMGMAWRQ